MHYIKTFFTSLLLCFIASLSSSAQLPPPKDPLTPAQAGQSAAACSAADASSCAQAAAKILPQVMGPSPMEENLRRLTDEIGGRVTGSPQMAKAVEWAVAAFRAEGLEVHTEKYTLPVTWSEGDTKLTIIEPQRPGPSTNQSTIGNIAYAVEIQAAACGLHRMESCNPSRRRCLPSCRPRLRNRSGFCSRWLRH